ncbi:MAG TPA: sigma-70 family RNA polymerase sigma factor [Longimicrobium sp.]|jgi:RNA polymerase sigma factor (sigma-70 family)
MPSRKELEALFLEHLPWIDRVCALLCRRHGLVGAEGEDFTSWARMRLVEDEYAALRKFRGESSLNTYLTVVVSMLFREYRVSRWGRWRPSAAARREGPVAVRLETLVRRDGYGLDQAVEVLRTSGDTDASQGELARMLARLPARTPLRPSQVGADELEHTPGHASADDLTARAESEAERTQLHDALSRALDRLSQEDRLILRMRFWEDLSVADIARGLSLPQKPLYRRIERTLSELRGHLQAAGITPDEVRSLLGNLEAE